MSESDKTLPLTMEQKIDLILQRLDSIETRLTTLESKQYDTRPIWEGVLVELEKMNRRMSHQDAKIDDFITEVIEMKRTMRT